MEDKVLKLYEYINSLIEKLEQDITSGNSVNKTYDNELLEILKDTKIKLIELDNM